MASAPSITRWSYDSDSGSIRRGSNWPAAPDDCAPVREGTQTGSIAPRETPRIATSGQLTIGVK